MTAFALHRADPSPVRPPSRAILLGLLIVLVAVAVVPTMHAVIRHGDDALAIRNCFNNGGPTQTWADLVDPNLFYRACRLPDGRWGLQVFRWREATRHFVERTAFIKGDGGEGALVRYLSRFAQRIGALPH